jgi:hypothetical protein
MATIERFDPPGGLADLDEAGLAAWSDRVSKWVDAAIAGRADHPGDGPRSQFYNPRRTGTADDARVQAVTWIAFPRQVRVSSVSDHQRWARADASRDVQDEYCEWSVARRADGGISRVIFTCESPEYWTLLAETRPDVALALYREHVDPAVRHDDLFDAAGRYIPRNRWNTTAADGAMHLVQSSNTLVAEIELAAAATVVRMIGGAEVTGEQELIECGRYGVAARNSDPHIGGVVNGIARLRADVTLTNPVGLYFDDLSTEGWEAPDGSDPRSFWTYARGTGDVPVRAVYEVPEDRGFTVSDVRIRGVPIAFGAQVADHVTMRLSATACRFGRTAGRPATACVDERAPAAGPPALSLR